ncbi:putative galectin [Trypoxylus dichotomus]
MEVELSSIKKPENNIENVEQQNKSVQTSKKVSERFVICPTVQQEQTPIGWPLSNGFPPGYMVRIQGLAHRGGKRFEINFAFGPDYQKSRIAFHSSVRFGEGGDLVKNSYDVDKRWEDEERVANLPIAPGQNFEIIVLCEPTKFKVAVGGVHFSEFDHRVPFTNIRHLDIRGDVTITLISYEDNTPQQRPKIENGYPL